MIRTLGRGAFAAMVAVLAASPVHAGPGPTVPAAADRVPSPQVFIIQGAPRSTVDIAIDGRSVRHSVEVKTIVGPLDLSRGKHTVAFTAKNWQIKSGFTIADASTDVVLHWPADKSEKPVVTVFSNDTSPVPADKARLTVAHTAVVPPADVRVDAKVLFANIANGEFVSADVPSDTYSVDIVPTGTKVNPIFGPLSLPVTAGALTRVFAIGQPKQMSMDAIVQTLPLEQAGTRAPDLVDAGSAGLVSGQMGLGEAPPASNEPGWSWLQTTIAAALVAVGLVAYRRRDLGRG